MIKNKMLLQLGNPEGQTSPVISDEKVCRN